MEIEPVYAVLICILIGALCFTAGLLVPRGVRVETKTEFQEVEVCDDPCGQCTALLDVIENNIERGNAAISNIGKLYYCSMPEHRNNDGCD